MTTGIRRLFDPAGLDEHGNPVTETVRDRIMRHTRRGSPAEVAAQSVGISDRVLRLWMQAGRSALIEIDVDPQVELTDEQRIAAAFCTDVEASLGAWLTDANVMLEAETRRRSIVTTKITQAADGTELERTIVTREEPGDLTGLAWRMGKVSQIYGRERIELTGADGGPVEVDIGARLNQVMSDIRATLTVDPGPEGLPRVNGSGPNGARVNEDELLANGESLADDEEGV